MGADSSNESKVDELKQQRNQIPIQNLDKSKVSKKNSPQNPNKNLSRQDAINSKLMQDYVKKDNIRQTNNNSKLNNSKFTHARQSFNNSKITNRNQSKISTNKQNFGTIKQQKLGNSWLPQLYQQYIVIDLCQILPVFDKKTSKFKNLQQKKCQQQGIIHGQYDNKSKNWTFQLNEDNDTSIKFTINCQNQILSGQKHKWLALCPVKQNNNLKKQGKFLFQHIYQSTKDQKVNVNSDEHSINKLQKDFELKKDDLFPSWGEKFFERKVNFLNKDLKNKYEKKKLKSNIYQNNILQNYEELNKFYMVENNKWILSKFIEQKEFQFRSWLIYQQIQQQNQEIQQLIQKQLKIIEIKKQIFICKIQSYLKQNTKQ